MREPKTTRRPFRDLLYVLSQKARERNAERELREYLDASEIEALQLAWIDEAVRYDDEI